MITYKNRELVYYGGWHNLDPDGNGILAGPDGIVTEVSYMGGILMKRIRCIQLLDQGWLTSFNYKAKLK